MNLIRRVEFFGDSNQPKFYDILRMLLGLVLLAKGITFLNNPAYLHHLILENQVINQPEIMISAITYGVTYLHLVGGALIFLGLFTRLVAICQLPIVFLAVFFVNILQPLGNAELWLSALVLILLTFFMAIGSGLLSLDGFLLGIKIDESRMYEL